MNFILTDELVNQIISAIENQDQQFVLDAQTLNLIPTQNQIKIDDDIIYALPEWKPADGFAMRESFVSQLHSPLAHQELQEVLHSGRGVFKTFRTVLKKYPEIDKRWHIYKHRIMSGKINEWYNSLREIWGLEKLDQLAESEESIVYDDFSFEAFDSQDNELKNEILSNINASFYENDTDIPEELGISVLNQALAQFKNLDQDLQTGFICYSLSEEFAGCVTVSPIFKDQENIMVLTSFFVPENFRGLGIATELLTMLISKVQDLGKKWIFMPDTITPELLEPLLTRMGFKKIRYGYIAEIH